LYQKIARHLPKPMTQRVLVFFDADMLVFEEIIKKSGRFTELVVRRFRLRALKGSSECGYFQLGIDMTSPSKPLSIGSSPRLGATDNNAQFQEPSISNTPDLRQQLRDRFGTPPVGTSIPAYRGSPAVNADVIATGTPGKIGSPLSRDYRAIVDENVASSSIPNDPLVEAIRSPPPDLPEDEKLKVLKKHLVSSREPRSSQPTGPQSRQSSRSRSKSRRTSLHGSTGLAVPSRGSNSNAPPSQRVSRTPSPVPSDSSEPFPLPYSALGGDVT
jgi:hypothetical protein